MDYQQKFAAINAVCEAHLCMRKPNDWYVNQPADIKDGSVLVGEYGNGSTPQEAIENHSDIFTKLLHNKYIVSGNGACRKAVRWNGFMWDVVIKPTVGAA